MSERYSDMMDEIAAAAQDILLHGAHEGPCTNEDISEFDSEPCELHLAAARRRHERLAQALREAGYDV